MYVERITRVDFTTGQADGPDGNARTEGYSASIAGKILAVHIDYGDNPPAPTTRFRLCDDHDPARETIVDLDHQDENVKLYPRRPLQAFHGKFLTDQDGHHLYGHYIHHGRLAATLTHANPGDFAIVTVWIES